MAYRPVDEQIEAVLGANAFAWAERQLAPGEFMATKRFDDFISVDLESVIRYVQVHGFPSDSWVFDEKAFSWGTGEIHDGLHIARDDDNWAVLEVDHGRVISKTRYPQHEAALRAVVERIWNAARRALTHDPYHMGTGPISPAIEGIGLSGRAQRGRT